MLGVVLAVLAMWTKNIYTSKFRTQVERGKESTYPVKQSIIQNTVARCTLTFTNGHLAELDNFIALKGNTDDKLD